MEKTQNNSFFKSILKGVAIALIFTFVCLTTFSLLLVNTNMSENLIQPVVIGVTCISILMGSCLANRKMNKNGILNGCIVGFLYVIVIYVISSIVNGMDFSLNSGATIMIVLGILGGAIGGIIGINI